jgi:hypothetical protein
VTLLKHLRNSGLVGAAIGAPLSALIVWAAATDSLHHFKDPSTGEVFYDELFVLFVAGLFWLIGATMAVYWLVVLLGRAIDAWAAPRGPRRP